MERGPRRGSGELTAPKAWRAKALSTSSEPAQVVAVADFLYRGRRDLVLLCVRPEKLTTELRYEALGTPEPYPHLYGPLNLGAVVGVVDFPPRADGSFQLPTDISSSVTP